MTDLVSWLIFPLLKRGAPMAIKCKLDLIIIIINNNNTWESLIIIGSQI